MTDGPTLPLRKRMLFGGAIFNAPEQSTVDELPERTQDLTTLYQWLPLQPVSTDVALLYALAADLARKGWGGVAYEVRRQADDLKMLTRHEA